MTAEEAINFLKDHEYWADFSWMDGVAEVAIEALEKQIPKKLVKTDDSVYTEACPNCDCGYTEEANYDFCPVCGQRLDWSNE